MLFLFTKKENFFSLPRGYAAAGLSFVLKQKKQKFKAHEPGLKTTSKLRSNA
jgi:hypothetical protein